MTTTKTEQLYPSQNVGASYAGTQTVQAVVQLLQEFHTRSGGQAVISGFDACVVSWDRPMSREEELQAEIAELKAKLYAYEQAEDARKKAVPPQTAVYGGGGGGPLEP